MLRASSILKNARLERDLSLDDISKKTKISVKYLNAFELEDTEAFPQEPYCSLIVKDYAAYLGLDGEQVLRFFRRDFAQKKKHKVASHAGFSFTPQFTFSVAVGMILILFGGFLVSEYIKFNRPPPLKVDWPESGLVLGSQIEIKGTTDPESTVRINQDLVIVEPDGSFKKVIKVSDQTSVRVDVESKSASGKTAKEEMTLILNEKK